MVCSHEQEGLRQEAFYRQWKEGAFFVILCDVFYGQSLSLKNLEAKFSYLWLFES